MCIPIILGRQLVIIYTGQVNQNKSTVIDFIVKNFMQNLS